MLCIVVLLWQFVCAGKEVPLKAFYSSSEGRITLRVEFRSGEKGGNSFRPLLDFYYEHVVLTSKKISQNGIDCDRDCLISGPELKITDNKSRGELRVRAGEVWVRPWLGSQPDSGANFSFFFKDNYGGYRDKNVLGLSANSLVWPAFRRLLDEDSATLRIRLISPASSPRQILRDFATLQAELTLISPPRLPDFFLEAGVPFAYLSSVSIEFADFSNIGFPGIIDLDSPWLFRISKLYYRKLADQIAQKICRNPKRCAQEADLSPWRLSGHLLQISFSSDDKNSGKVFGVSLSVQELYSITSDGRILFNFSFFSESKDYYSIQLGILLLKRFDLYLSSSERGEGLSFMIADRCFNNPTLHLYLCFVAFVVAIIVTRECVIIAKRKQVLKSSIRCLTL